MNAERVALAALAVAFIAAELVRPTRFETKRIATRALVMRSQEPGRPRGATLDPELLDDLPRIRPDALGSAQTTADGATVSGWIADPDARTPGAAVFVIVDGVRRGALPVAYGLPTGRRAVAHSGYRIALRGALQPGVHELVVALVAADQRGYFRLPSTLRVAIAQ